MMRINFILELNKLRTITSTILGSEMLGWITTYIPSLIEHLLARNLGDFQRHLDRLVRDEGLREQLGQQAYASVRQRFDIRQIASVLKDIYLSEIHRLIRYGSGVNGGFTTLTSS
ncbi:MAG: glycosyltransferase family 1 protein [Acidobacteria bacterium]|nr:glycosyltransferase family 1 protein [Acidobacteriota bacterium]